MSIPLHQRVLKLPARKRMSLAVLLLESLEEPNADAALLEDLKRRSEELRSGSLKYLTTEQAYGFSL
jgi:Putative addiction module component